MTEDEFNSLTDLPDLLSHLHAVLSMVSAVSAWNDQFSKRADAASEYAMHPEADMDAVIAAYEDSGYASMAESLSVITTTAAFLESVFKQCLPKMEICYDGTLQPNHPRVLDVPQFWDPRHPRRDNSGIARRTIDILEAAELIDLFGANFPKLITAIFSYRNQMVHGGFEWEEPERGKFKTRIEKESWEKWFSISTSNNQPWYFTMTGQFRADCLELCERSVYAFEGLIWKDWDHYEGKFGRRGA